MLVMEVEVEGLRVSFGLLKGDILDLGRSFAAVVVEMEVDDLKLEEGDVFRPVGGCLNGRLYFLWRLSRMSLAGKMSSACGRSFGLVMREDLFTELFFHDGTCLGKVNLLSVNFLYKSFPAVRR